MFQIFDDEWRYKVYFLGYYNTSSSYIVHNLMFYSHGIRFVLKITNKNGILSSELKEVKEFKIPKKCEGQLFENSNYMKAHTYSEKKYSELTPDFKNRYSDTVFSKISSMFMEEHEDDILLISDDESIIIPLITKDADDYIKSVYSKAEMKLLLLTMAGKNLTLHPEEQIKKINDK